MATATEGYVHCACRDCMAITIGKTGEALCDACEEAGCEAGAEQECKSADAYGCGNEIDD